MPLGRSAAPQGNGGHVLLAESCPRSRDEDERSNSDLELSEQQGPCKKVFCTPLCACGLCSACAICVAVIAALCVLYVNTMAKRVIERVGTAALGVETSVESVNIGILHASSTISHLSIASPEGFGPDDFLDLSLADFDMNFLSLFKSPFELEKFDVSNCRVSVNRRMNGDSNAHRIISHARQVSREYLPHSRKSSSLQTAMKALTVKIKVDKLRFLNVSSKMCLHPMCDAAGPTFFTIREVAVNGAGEDGQGLYLYELLQLVVRSLLSAALHAAEGHLSSSLARGFHDVKASLFGYGARSALGGPLAGDAMGGVRSAAGNTTEEALEAADALSAFVGNVTHEFGGLAHNASAAAWGLGTRLDRVFGGLADDQAPSPGLVLGQAGFLGPSPTIAPSALPVAGAPAATAVAPAGLTTLAEPTSLSVQRG